MEMTEDRGFESLLKAALEDGIKTDDEKVRVLERLAELSAPKGGRSLRRGWNLWGAASLLAASFAVAVAFRVLLAPQDGRSGADVFEDTIGLLCELDGIAKEDLAAASDGELLLAWQEAPCADFL